MDADHAPWRERVLAYEDLDDAERRETDAHLATCEPCRALLKALQERERNAALEGQLTLASPPLAAADARAERESLERLVAKALPAAEPVAPPRPRRVIAPLRPWRWVWLPAAAAAVVIVAVVLNPGRKPTPPLARIESLDVVRMSSLRGVADSVFHTGDAFAVRLRLTAPAVPIVVVVDEAGVPTLLHPASGESLRVAGPGEVVLPDSAVVWRFSGEPGRETFLSCAAPIGADLDALRASLTTATSGVAERDARVRAVRTILASLNEKVEELTVRHVR